MGSYRYEPHWVRRLVNVDGDWVRCLVDMNRQPADKTAVLAIIPRKEADRYAAHFRRVHGDGYDSALCLMVQAKPEMVRSGVNPLAVYRRADEWHATHEAPYREWPTPRRGRLLWMETPPAIEAAVLERKVNERAEWERMARGW
jgi:hypothetical protein